MQINLEDAVFAAYYELQIATHSQGCNKSLTLQIPAYRCSPHVGLHVRLMKQMLRLGLGLNFSLFRIMHHPQNTSRPCNEYGKRTNHTTKASKFMTNDCKSIRRR